MLSSMVDPDFLSGIRLLGLAVGVVSMIFAFFYFRGQRWHRGNFILFTVFGVMLVALGLDPDLVASLQRVLNVGEEPFGRIITVLILATFCAYFLILYTKSKIDSIKIMLDRVIRSSALFNLTPEQVASRVAPVMIIIPALNEAENLELLLPKIPQTVCGLGVGVLVVDDCSTDQTSQVAFQHGFLAVRNIVNRGQGAASRVGYDFLKRYNVEIGVTMDADNQHRPEDIERLVQPILDGTSDLVIGSRVLGSHDGNSAVRSLGIVVLTNLINLLTGLKITDCSSGFKAFRMGAMQKLELREDQFQASEVLIIAAKCGLKVSEVPIHINRRSFGVSRKGTNFTYGFFFFKVIVKSWWR